MADDLDRYLLGKPIEARPVGVLERVWLWSRRNPALSVLAASLVLALITGTIVSTAFALIASDRSRQANRQAELAKRRLYDVRMTQVPGYRDNWNPDLFLRTLNDELQVSQAGVDRRGFEWHYWRNKILTEVATLTGHSQRPWRVDFSPDGTRLLSASVDGSARVWATETGRSILVLDIGRGERGRDAAFSPDASRIVSLRDDGTVRVWDAESGRESQYAPIPGQMFAACSSANECVIASFGPGSIPLNPSLPLRLGKVWDLATGRMAFTVRQHSEVLCIAICPTTPWLAVARADVPGVEICDLLHPRVAITLRGELNYVTGLSFSRDGRRLATASPYPDGIVKIWETQTGRELKTLKDSSLVDQPGAAHIGGAIIPLPPYLSVALNHDGSRLATSNGAGILKIWDTDTGQAMFALEAQKRVQLVFSPNGNQLAATGTGGQMMILDVESGKETLSHFRHEIGPTRYAYGESGVIFSPDGSRLASIGDDGTIKIWIASARQNSLTLNTDCKLNSVSFSPDGRRVAAAGSDELVHIWDTSDGRVMPWLSSQSNRVRGVAFSPNGLRIASAGGNETVTVWDSILGTRVQVLKSLVGDQLSSVAFSPDGLRIAGAGRSGRLVSWNTMTGQEALGISGGAYLFGDPWAGAIMAFSPDGVRIACSKPYSGVTVRNASNGREVFRLSEGNIVAFSPDGLWIASAEDDPLETGKAHGSITLWEAASGTKKLVLSGHSGPVN